MNCYEFIEPYYALIKADTDEKAVKKYIEVVAGDESDFDVLLEECKIVPAYYASARLAQIKNENGKLADLDEVIETFERVETEVLVVDGSLL
ncbi:hypothetical protein [Heyndrickxia ginsengihumi]|uniref:hypothetical protein n=1 Tax=Heyndrickxia ginsengihumi TaxID=363870 RepID=UPI000470277D|nr:hypothetical protein [Heyndrickxia ginsengihumi]